MGYCLYGNDIDETINPIQAGLKWATKINKDFIGKKHILKSLENGVEKKLIGFKLTDRGIPRKDYKIFDSNKMKLDCYIWNNVAYVKKRNWNGLR